MLKNKKRETRITREEKGITLVALVVTIIVLIILSAISINVIFSNDGILERAKKSVIEHKKAKYFEDIKLEILEERLDRASQQKEEAFITSLANRLSPHKKDWVSDIIKCTDDLDKKENDYENNLLLITTKEDYEIYVAVNNGNLVAAIREGSFSKAGKDSVVTYDKNTGTGTMENQSIKTGFYITLRENTFTKTNYSFVGWCKDKNGTGEKYASGSKIKIEADTTLYAIWSQDIVTITYNANGGEGQMEATEVKKGDSINIASNTFTKSGYIFDKWNTKADRTGTEYENNGTITANYDIELYAQWKLETLKITFDVNGGSNLTISSWDVEKGQAYSTKGDFPTATPPSGKTLIGWYTESSGGTRVTKNNIPTANTTLYAQYETTINNFSYTGVAQKYITPNANVTYRMECWGAGGCYYNDANGQKVADQPLGGYVAGDITVGSKTFHIYVGQCYYNGGNTFNGCYAPSKYDNARGGAGSGATDIRLEDGNWDNATSLNSRILVAGGTGSRTSAAGGLQGYTGYKNSGTAGTGGTQTSGASFGIGGTPSPGFSTDWAGGGGGGYYGGTAGYDWDMTAYGGGGSSYISGHTGCVAITSSTDRSAKGGATTGTTNIEYSKHYSGLFFTNTLMIDGNGFEWTNIKSSLKEMPNPLGGNYDAGIGHIGDGYARITIISVDINN